MVGIMNPQSDVRKQPFFVLGAQRSGTTMLRLMLNSHPNLAIPHETAFMTLFRPKLHEYGDLAHRKNAARLLDDIAEHPLVVRGRHIVDKAAILSHPIANFADLIDAIMSEYAAAQGKSRWGDKTPFYTPDIDVLWQLFPGAKFLHLVRDGRDVALSQRTISWLSTNLQVLAGDWRWKTTVCHKVGAVIGPDQFLEMRYEDLVRDPEGCLRRICQFIEEPFADEMLRYHESAQAVVPTESLQWHRNSVRAPNPGKLFEWKHKLSVSDRIIYEQIAGSALDLFGYEREHLASTLGSRLKNFYYAAVVRW
jgi:hypothetical protein